MQGLKGMHHVTAITSSAEKNYNFFTYDLGMRLVKKTVNQDDIQTYHLFFADDKGSPGTDMTFFDFPGVPKGRHGTNEIAVTSFRVPSDEALEYWARRFDRLKIKHQGIDERFGAKFIAFEDFDTQQYQLVSDENNQGVASGTPWQDGPIPLDYAITGLGPIIVKISEFEQFKTLFEQVYQFKEVASEGECHLFEVGEGGHGGQVIIEKDSDSPQAIQGFGTVHHAAFRVSDREGLDEWIERMQTLGVPNSGYVDRFYFESLYTKISQHILFEIATDGPGFMGDEPYETLGESLSIPPKFAGDREEIESLVRPIDTVRSTKTIEKEYD